MVASITRIQFSLSVESNLYSSVNVRDQVSCPCKTSDRMNITPRSCGLIASVLPVQKLQKLSQGTRPVRNWLSQTNRDTNDTANICLRDAPQICLQEPSFLELLCAPAGATNRAVEATWAASSYVMTAVTPTKINI
jgi:hypothetical protein